MGTSGTPRVATRASTRCCKVAALTAKHHRGSLESWPEKSPARFCVRWRVFHETALAVVQALKRKPMCGLGSWDSIGLGRIRVEAWVSGLGIWVNGFVT